MIRMSSLVSSLVVLGLAGPAAVLCAAAAGLDYDALSSKMLERLSPTAEEHVLLAVHGTRFSELAAALERKLQEAGSRVLVHDATENLPEEKVLALLEGTEAVVILPGLSPEHTVYRLLQGLLREGKKRAIHFHWEGAYPLPGGKLPNQAEIDLTYQKAVLQSDYQGIGEHQRRFVQALRRSEVRVTTRLGTDLRFRVGDRPVCLQDGDATAQRARNARTVIDREVELPAGVIRVAPLEASVNGIIVFPPGAWNGKDVGRVALRLVDGQAVEISSPDGDDTRSAAVQELEQGGSAARSFREFALGFNPLLAVPENEPWIPYYGYGAGVVRLSLGDNSELGGEVRGTYVRWNFFVDASVTVDGEEWVQEGKLIR